ncbi:hypothetical protein [Pseudidiomarina terrestris]|uniref:Uncharacterized protein n=1 Tax=Pseudidiomarina terrestris TaxID=2820060 RepID=A0AAW7QXS7_9GAMM|nr:MULTISPECIES: hypothetical protein [unclassified Pseudidiomarina]MDN7124559.1 hypothetical protein [Pseudidiomarina sp. 1APP75-32.1]MDN7129150.1 hypothetical protein [Pseudidiomarina sp. 1APR75-15]MDN7134586.1 hypothetical protein [Pseudidiomarina sp. 1ASP75-5]
MNLRTTLTTLLVVTAALALAGCNNEVKRAETPPPPPTGGGDDSTSFRILVRDAYAQESTAAPITVNDKDIDFDVLDTAEFDDLIASGTINGRD